MTDFSQFGEQEHILRLLGPGPGRFLDIGAFDGSTGSNTRQLALQGWSGLCIEPCYEQFAQLVTLYDGTGPVKALNAAVVYGSPKIIRFLGGNGLGQVSSSNPNWYDIWAKPHRDYFVAGVNANQIMYQFGGHWDFASIDTESFEAETLIECDRLLRSTRVLVIEDLEEKSRTQDILGFLGFKIAIRTKDSAGGYANIIATR